MQNGNLHDRRFELPVDILQQADDVILSGKLRNRWRVFKAGARDGLDLGLSLPGLASTEETPAAQSNRSPWNLGLSERQSLRIALFVWRHLRELLEEHFAVPSVHHGEFSGIISNVLDDQDRPCSGA